jgi:hypothetical protein
VIGGRLGSRRSLIGKEEEETGESVFCLHPGSGGGEMRAVDLVWRRMKEAWSGWRRPDMRAHGGGWGAAGAASGAHHRHIRRSRRSRVRVWVKKEAEARRAEGRTTTRRTERPSRRVTARRKSTSMLTGRIHLEGSPRMTWRRPSRITTGGSVMTAVWHAWAVEGRA